jgi:hypothetical protein
MTRLIAALTAIAIAFSLTLVGVYQAKVAHNPAHMRSKRVG